MKNNKINIIRKQLDEKLIVGLRRREGVDFKQLAEFSGWNKRQFETNMHSFELNLQDAIQRGLLIKSGWRFRLSDPLGMEISNQVFLEIIIWWDNLPTHLVASNF